LGLVSHAAKASATSLRISVHKSSTSTVLMIGGRETYYRSELGLNEAVTLIKNAQVPEGFFWKMDDLCWDTPSSENSHMPQKISKFTVHVSDVEHDSPDQNYTIQLWYSDADAARPTALASRHSLDHAGVVDVQDAKQLANNSVVQCAANIKKARALIYSPPQVPFLVEERL